MFFYEQSLPPNWLNSLFFKDPVPLISTTMKPTAATEQGYHNESRLWFVQLFLKLQREKHEIHNLEENFKDIIKLKKISK